MRRFFIEPSATTADTTALSPSDSKHICTVLRLKPGTEVLLFDGTGVEYLSEIVSISQDRVWVSIRNRLVTKSVSSTTVTVAQGFLKEKKMDGLVRSLTELGVHRFIPFFAERSVARPSDHRLEGRVERWQTIARESLKQCRRSRPPEIVIAPRFDDVMALSAGSDLKIAFWEKAVEAVPASSPAAGESADREVFVLLGPEGGLTEGEISTATAAGFAVATLGPRILRAETASLAACTLVQYLWGDLRNSPP